MPYRILVDENVDRRVADRLVADGHDAVHVEGVGDLGKGTADRAIATRSLETDRLVLTRDDDFLTDFDRSAYAGLLFVPDESMDHREIGAAVTAIASLIPQAEVERVYVTRRWL